VQFRNLGLEGFCVGLTFTHGDPDIEGNCVRLKLRGHNHPYWPRSEGVFAGPLRLMAEMPEFVQMYDVMRHERIPYSRNTKARLLAHRGPRRVGTGDSLMR